MFRFRSEFRKEKTLCDSAETLRYSAVKIRPAELPKYFKYRYIFTAAAAGILLLSFFRSFGNGILRKDGITIV